MEGLVEEAWALADAANPGEAAGVDGVDQQKAHILGDVLGNAASQQPDLNAGTAERLRPMGSRHDNQDALSVVGTEPGGLGRKSETVGAGRGVVITLQRGRSARRGIPELLACRRVIG